MVWSRKEKDEDDVKKCGNWNFNRAAKYLGPEAVHSQT